ncbi:PRC-barrel domain containing protein [Qipengyuania sp. XHP0211]|uniref:PRC-barrel domain containing protein n=1 Tax=Qipengyuania sp. XHP0211 TaxID=3038079 RepID=UPI00241BFC4E|nr:PRC-barrel domain containing protein [Qipengyuania sp. XHP0211]MDG5750281.1 PRC-barrel domain containing protein [Qipengyuania sp. XHP0211]
MNKFAPLLLGSALLLSACNDQEDQVEDRIEEQAEQSAQESGDTPVALGLTERQLLDAEILAADGTELGDVEAVTKDADGNATELLIEVEDSDPDRYVAIPIDGLTVTTRGNDTDLSSEMTMEDIGSLPDAQIL